MKVLRGFIRYQSRRKNKKKFDPFLRHTVLLMVTKMDNFLKGGDNPNTKNIEGENI